MLGFDELLRLRGIDPNRSKIKLVRHSDSDGVVDRVVEAGLLEEYQRYQPRFFAEWEYLAAFIGDAGGKARLFGVYRIANSRPMIDAPPALTACGWVDYDMAKQVVLDLEPVTEFEDLAGRVVIDWGKGALAWHQNSAAKEVVQILPSGYVRPFTGYLDFILTYDELCDIITRPDANSEWRTMLRGVAGVYLIVDSRTGMQYVGSAYGKQGIWGRWEQYAKTGHGHNAKLVALHTEEIGCARHFRFSILRTLAKTLTSKEVIAQEALFKKKLGSRAFGLNSN